MITLEEAKRHVRTYGLADQLLTLLMLLEVHITDLEKRDRSDYYWSTLADLSVERIARWSLFEWVESELVKRYPDDRRIENLGYRFHGLCREVNSRISELPTEERSWRRRRRISRHKPRPPSLCQRATRRRIWCVSIARP